MESNRSNEIATLKGLLGELALIDGVAGHEHAVVARLNELLEPLVDDIEIDSYGNLFATRRGPATSPSLMISAHSDEIGAIVKSIEPSGMIRFERLGGLVETLTIGRHIKIRGLRGVVGVKAGHIQTPDERGRAPGFRELYIDMGFESADEVRALGIRVGDAISYDEPMVELANSTRVAGKALDNRVGCAIVVELARRLQGVALNCTLHLVVTVQEEVGLRGAQMATHRLNPTAAIVVDTVPSGGTPDVDFYRDLSMRIGAGPVLPVSSGGGARGFLANPAMRDFLNATAETAGIAVQEAVFVGGNSDAAAVHMVRDGIPTGVVNIARRYSHSPVEMLDMRDALGAVDLLDAAARAFGPETDLGFLSSRWG
ncbi:MAG TPA: M42 family metallopeptidase [Nitrolancea sp.]